MGGFTLAEMRGFAEEAWGAVGTAACKQWSAYNKLYLGGRLRPIPLLIEARRPIGNRVVDCEVGGANAIAGRRLRINVSVVRRISAGKVHEIRSIDNHGLLHAMLHQFLLQQGKDATHGGDPWREAIMRMSRAIGGTEVWAGASRVQRVPVAMNRFVIRKDRRGREYKVRLEVERVDDPPPEDGVIRLVLGQQQIARWPTPECGIDLGTLEIG